VSTSLEFILPVTFNRFHGLTVLRLGVDLRRAVFSHGELYSAMTRVPTAQDVPILQEVGDGNTFTPDVVWEELLLSYVD
jgi:hypothetical protein